MILTMLLSLSLILNGVWSSDTNAPIPFRAYVDGAHSLPSAYLYLFIMEWKLLYVSYRWIVLPLLYSNPYLQCVENNLLHYLTKLALMKWIQAASPEFENAYQQIGPFMMLEDIRLIGTQPIGVNLRCKLANRDKLMWRSRSHQISKAQLK
jgi:hypothetical protein